LFFYDLQNLRGTFFHADAAGIAFCRIRDGEVRAEVDALLGALFHADAAFAAGDLAAFRDLLPVEAAVRTKHHHAFLIFGDGLDKGLGTFSHAHAAAGAFSEINYRQAFYNVHTEGIEFARFHAVAEAEASVRTEPGSARRQFRSPAVFNAGVDSLLRSIKIRTLTTENRYGLLYRFSRLARDLGEFFNKGGTADRTGTDPGVSGCYGYRVIFTAGKTAGAAVGAGQGFANFARKGVLRYGEEILEKTQGGSKNKSDSKRECRSYYYYNHCFPRIPNSDPQSPVPSPQSPFNIIVPAP
jgi:hypothetical protein